MKRTVFSPNNPKHLIDIRNILLDTIDTNTSWSAIKDRIENKYDVGSLWLHVRGELQYLLNHKLVVRHRNTYIEEYSLT